MRRSQPKRDWEAAREKVDAEGQCRVCGSTDWLQAAHVIGREADRDAGYIVVPLRVVPLCKPCHDAYDAHTLDLLPYLRLEEQIAAVRDADGMVAAYTRVTGERPW